MKAAVGAVSRISGMGDALLRWYGVNNGAIVLSFHRVVRQPYFRPQMAVSLETFTRLLDYLCEQAVVVDLSQLQTLPPQQQGRKRVRVALTFDDGYRDNYDNAFPELSRRGLPATVFLTTASIDNPEQYLWWDALAHVIGQLDGLPADRAAGVRAVLRAQGVDIARRHENPHGLVNDAVDRLRTLPQAVREQVIRSVIAAAGDAVSARPRIALAWHEVRSMAERGIRFGGHTVNHPNLDELTSSQLRAEITECKERIESQLGQPVEAFAYPSGRYTAATVDAVRSAGYRAACTTETGAYRPGGNILRIPRIDISDDMVRGKSKPFSPNLWYYQLLRHAK